MNNCCCKCCEKCNPPGLTAEELHELLHMDVREFLKWDRYTLIMFALMVVSITMIPIGMACMLVQWIVFGEVR